MEAFPALLAICAGNSPVPGEFPTQRPVTRSFDVFFDLRLNKRLSKQPWGWWFETLSRPLWRHRNGTYPKRMHLHIIFTYAVSLYIFAPKKKITFQLDDPCSISNISISTRVLYKKYIIWKKCHVNFHLDDVSDIWAMIIMWKDEQGCFDTFQEDESFYTVCF